MGKNPESERFDVFLSYDKGSVGDSLAPAFFNNFESAFKARHAKGRNLKFFLDRDDINVGDNWRERLELGLRHCRLVVIMVADGMLQRSVCLKEIQFAQTRIDFALARDLQAPVVLFPVKAYDDSSIFREFSGSDNEKQAKDARFLDDLNNQQKSVVHLLRDTQYQDGTVFFTQDEDSAQYKTALQDLVGKAIACFNEVEDVAESESPDLEEQLNDWFKSVEQEDTIERTAEGGTDPGADRTGDQTAAKRKWMVPGALGASALVVLIALIALPVIPEPIASLSFVKSARCNLLGYDAACPKGPDKPDGNASERVDPEPVKVGWRSAGADGTTLENHTDNPVATYEAPDLSSGKLQPIQPSTVVPAAGTDDLLETATIQGKVWFRYKQVPSDGISADAESTYVYVPKDGLVLNKK